MNHHHPEAWQTALDQWVQRLVGHEAVEVEVDVSPGRLRRAQREAARITWRQFPAAYVAMLVLPTQQRRAMHAMAAFLRKADVLSERTDAEANADWERWCAATLAETPPTDDDILLAFADARVRHRIPRTWIAEELRGLGNDREAPGLGTMEDLAKHCFDVLGPIGLVALRIVGAGRSAELPGTRFTVAAQLSDVLCDIAEDLREGRSYLPADELSALGVDLERVQRQGPDAGWRTFMRRMIARNRRLYASAEPGLRRLPLFGALCASVLGALLLCQLEDIEARDYDLFRHPPRFRVGHVLSAIGAAVRVLRARVGRGREPRVWASAYERPTAEPSPSA